MAERREGNYLRKGNVTMSLSVEGQRLLHELALLKGINRSSVVEVLIREEAARIGIKVRRISSPIFQERTEGE